MRTETILISIFGLMFVGSNLVTAIEIAFEAEDVTNIRPSLS